MGECSRVDNYSVNIFIISFLNLIYNSSLVITLEYFDFYPKLLCFILNHVYQCFIIICSIYSFFPYSKKINIRTIQAGG